MAETGHGWVGSGTVRIARHEERLCVEFDGVAARAGAMRDALAELCREEYRSLVPAFDPFAVGIWIDAPWGDPLRARRIDADSVARSCLDALKGFVWRDESQVLRLTVEKIPAERERVTVVTEPYDASNVARLVDLRFAIAALADRTRVHD